MNVTTLPTIALSIGHGVAVEAAVYGVRVL